MEIGRQTKLARYLQVLAALAPHSCLTVDEIAKKTAINTESIWCGLNFLTKFNLAIKTVNKEKTDTFYQTQRGENVLKFLRKNVANSAVNAFAHSETPGGAYN